MGFRLQLKGEGQGASTAALYAANEERGEYEDEMDEDEDDEDDEDEDMEEVA